MKKRRTVSVLTGVLLGAFVGGGAAVLVAGASSEVSPRTVGEGEIITEWNAALERSELELPVGIAFPQDPPAFFTSALDTPEVDQFEAGLFDDHVRQFWRCSWLAVESESVDATRQDRVAAEAQLDAFAGELPVEVVAEFEDYQQALEDVSMASGESPEAIEYVTDCEGVTR
ncbi:MULTISPECIES: hypothetical protein [Microbacterium]|jgi:hypothetical protein|uniref:hypothetical protein n=1 Tax=Microbacterium TaxID=33882 RepID=UPI000FEF55D3|nr:MULTISPECIES: hypothetical protein [Microbacterium]MDQ1216726.1 hypothetical protein [Microbacterium arborescens]RKE63643.1 hypothetical protein DEU36_0854 [Microbacterium sp. AG238]